MKRCFLLRQGWVEVIVLDMLGEGAGGVEKSREEEEKEEEEEACMK